MAELINSETTVNAIYDQLKQESFTLPDEAKQLTAYQWANLLESLQNESRLRIWPEISKELRATILSEMREDARNQLVSSLSEKDLLTAFRTSDNSAAIGIIDVLPSKKAQKLVNKLSPKRQSQIESSLNYDEHQIGRYANSNAYTINNKAIVKDAIEEIKSSPDTNDIVTFWVVDEQNILLGEVSFSELLSSDDSLQVSALTRTPDKSINDRLGLLDGSNIIRGSTKPQLPVIDANGVFIGTFSQHDALNVFQEHYEAQIAHLGKVSDEDLFAPVALSARRRAVWLGINLVTAFIASFVIGLFDKVLVEVVALAVLMPIVASMGGITGSQTLTLTIRGMATGQLAANNFGILRTKELLVSVINGVLWAVVVAIATAYWFDNYLLSAILAFAMIINMAVASLSGLMIPKVLEKIGIDPALAGSVILTTVTDVVGFFVFLGGATLLFLGIG